MYFQRVFVLRVNAVVLSNNPKFWTNVLSCENSILTVVVMCWFSSIYFPTRVKLKLSKAKPTLCPYYAHIFTRSPNWISTPPLIEYLTEEFSAKDLASCSNVWVAPDDSGRATKFLRGGQILWNKTRFATPASSVHNDGQEWQLASLKLTNNWFSMRKKIPSKILTRNLFLDWDSFNSWLVLFWSDTGNNNRRNHFDIFIEVFDNW